MNIDFEQLGKRIAQRRHELGLKQCILAEKSGISNNYLSNIENGRSIPSLETFSSICIALSLTPDYLLLGTIRADNIPQSIVNNLKPELFTPLPGNRVNTGKTLIKMKNRLSPKR